ncbi:MAG: MOSC domain-containing protein [Proteobacteria bacterium]|jgi:MOSC domain-containing protein YiiM|nr:MOSC domain-containing protein [Pseudomonadota bacterium]
MAPTIHELMDTLPQQGTVSWIGVRPARGKAMEVQTEVLATAGSGLAGDRFRARNTDREVTLIQAEHIIALSSLLHRRAIDPATLRRNIVVQGVNLLALKGKTFRIGNAILQHTGTADPCSAMEAALGPGGYNAMRGHGGITARVLESGRIAVGDSVRQCVPDSGPAHKARS